MKRIICLSLIFVYAFAFAQNVKTTLTYLVHKPDRMNKHTPVLIVMHGYGSNETDLMPFSKDVAKDFLIFSLQAPQPIQQGGYCWFDLEFLPDQKFKCNYKQLEISRGKILSFISNACSSYNVDSTAVFLMGFSQGATMAYDLAISTPQKIKGILALSGLFMEETKTLKANWTTVANVKMFIAHGTSDKVVKYSDAEICADFLKSKKIKDLTFSNYEIGHSLHPNEIKDLFNWLEKNKR